MILSIDTPDFVLEILNRLGRTEDLSFSPNNKRLAIVGYQLSKILILDVELVKDGPNSKIMISDCFELCSTSFKNPHGIAWIDNETVVVANRFGGSILLALPFNIKKGGGNPVWLLPLKLLPPVGTFESVSTDCVHINLISKEICEVLLCSNSGNYVSSHLINIAENFNVEASSVLLNSKIDVPDGIALSYSKGWLAVSNHDGKAIFVYKNLRSLNPGSAPDAILRGVGFPHGIKFIEDSHFLFVSDAGGPFVYVYYSASGEWSGDYQPVSKYRVMSDEAFKMGHVNPQEGGVKGIDFFKDSFVMATTCQEQRLAFFDLSATLKNVASVGHNKKLPQRSPSVDDYFYRAARTMQIGQERLITGYVGMVNHHRNEFQKIISSRSWKITYPLRLLNGHLKKLILSNKYR